MERQRVQIDLAWLISFCNSLYIYCHFIPLRAIWQFSGKRILGSGVHLLQQVHMDNHLLIRTPYTTRIEHLVQTTYHLSQLEIQIIAREKHLILHSMEMPLIWHFISSRCKSLNQKQTRWEVINLPLLSMICKSMSSQERYWMMTTGLPKLWRGIWREENVKV